MKPTAPLFFAGAVAGAFGLGLLIAHHRAPTAPVTYPSDPVLAERPVQEAYALLAEAEERHELRFHDALDPDAARAGFEKSLADAARAGDAKLLATVGLDLFTRDLSSRASSTNILPANRCASCHSRGGPGGAGGLVDDVLEGLNPPSLAGAPLLERLGQEMTRELQDEARNHAPRLEAKGIDFGTPDQPVGVGSDLVVRPFGWTARWATLDEAISAMGEKALGVKLKPEEIAALKAFVVSLPPPVLSPPDASRTPDLFLRFESGRRRFTEIGCAKCHVPELSLADGTKVAAFTDLKLRDLGSSGPEEKHHLWRTPPLWGVASTAPYLHDGSALASLAEAIARHGADPSAQAFAKLPAEGQGEVLVFLLSLTRSPQIQIAGR